MRNYKLEIMLVVVVIVAISLLVKAERDLNNKLNQNINGSDIITVKSVYSEVNITSWRVDIMTTDNEKFTISGHSTVGWIKSNLPKRLALPYRVPLYKYEGNLYYIADGSYSKYQ